MRVGDYLAVLERTRTPRERELAVLAILEELASGAELTAAQEAVFLAEYRTEQDIRVAGLLNRALGRLATRRHMDRDPSERFDRKLAPTDRDALASLVARVRLLVDSAQGHGAFAERYEVVRELDTGGMGRVAVGRRTADGATVAIKVILDEHLDNEAIRGRFRREAQILERLDHPRIVRLHEWGEVGRQIYLITEYLEGGDVAVRMERSPLTRPDRFAALLQTLEALAACHEAGIIHRDIKPANLFLVRDGTPVEVKLGDFGLAKDLHAPDGLTHAGTVMGSAPYTAKEQHDDPAHVTTAADLYAFGVTAYEILSGGRLPVGNYPPLSAIAPEYAPELDWIVARCLEPRPQDRWRSATDLQRAIASVALSSAGA